MVRVLRVLLVFTLVFWSTFRIEMIAFADEDSQDAPATEVPTENAETGEGRGQGGTADDNQGEGQDGGQGNQGNNQGGGQGESGQGGQGQGGNQGASEPAAPAVTFDRLEIRRFIDNADVSTNKFAYLGDVVGSTKEKQKPGQVPKIDTREGELKLVPIVVLSNGDIVDMREHVEWSLGEEASEVVELKAGDIGSPQVLKAKGAKNAEIDVKCKLKSKDVAEAAKVSADQLVEISFTVSIINQESALVIDSIDVLDESGNVLSGSSALKVPFDEKDGVSYQFAAQVTYRDTTSENKEEQHKITTADDNGLTDDEKKLLEGLTWSVDDDLASVDGTGLFKTNAKLETMVTCSVSVGGSTVLGRARVNTGVDNDVQGEYHPQDSLRVVMPANVLTAGDATDAEEASSSAVSPQGGMAERVADGAETQPDEEADGQAPVESTAPSVVEQVFSLDELSSIGWKDNVTQVLGSTTIIGEGPSLTALLEAAGIDLAKVETVTFVDYDNASHRLSWSAVSSDDVILAANSLVHVNGQPDSPLLKNTRFRLMPGDGGSLESAYPWIRTIIINDANTGSGNGDGKVKDDSLQPVVFYNPVPVGYTAVLTAAVIGLFEGEQFGLEWEQSDDGGATWSGAIDTAQTIRVPVSDSTLGRMYRVKVTTNYDRENESEAVTIREPSEGDFSVNLAYDPPKAGDIAFFNTRVFGVEPSEITDYIWEWTEDGGNTWQEIAGSRGNPTFSAKTDPIDDSSGGEGDAEGNDTGSEGDGDSSGSSSSASADKDVNRTPASSMWVRVRVLATNSREAISNPVMLTVHVSDDPGTGQLPTDDIPDDPSEKPSAPGSDESVVSPTDSKEDTAASPAANPTTDPVVQEVTSITQESAPRSQSTSPVVTSQPATEQTPDGTETAPTPESAASDSPTDLVINPQVTAEILEQREAVNAAVQATRPGARWTALTTVDPDGKDIQRILNDNPFVPFTAPFALGITAAGFVEKLLGFRRQVR